MEELFKNLTQVLEMIESVAPTVWQIAMKQVAVQQIQSVLWLICGLVVIVSSLYTIRWGVAYGKEEGDDMAPIMIGLFGSIGAMVGLLITVSMTDNIIQYTMNPEWTAIQLILKQIKP